MKKILIGFLGLILIMVLCLVWSGHAEKDAVMSNLTSNYWSYSNSGGIHYACSFDHDGYFSYRFVGHKILGLYGEAYGTFKINTIKNTIEFKAPNGAKFKNAEGAVFEMRYSINGDKFALYEGSMEFGRRPKTIAIS